MTWPQIDETHDPALACWVESAASHPDFPIQNLPLGIFSTADSPARPGVAIGDRILDLQTIAAHLPEAAARTLTAPTLNALLALPAADRRALRRALSRLLSNERHRAEVEPALIRADTATLHLPVTVGGYTDFYTGIHHAVNVGKQFRPENPLLPNYKYVPIGYHGRTSSIRPSGVPVTRPNGQRKAPDSDVPSYGPTRRLDYELELGLWVGPGNELGRPIPIGQAPEHVAGICLLNDWSARDLQAWEYQPLGPFLAKNFHSTVSPWVVTADALAPFWTAQPPRPEGDPAPLPYLFDAEDQASGALALNLEVALSTARMREAGLPPQSLSHSTTAAMYWTAAQIVTHHSSNGCNLQPGDLLGSGTLSSAEKSGYGSLTELSRAGAEPIELLNGETRAFLEDGDELTLIARGIRDGFASIGFGSCSAIVLPAVAP